MPRNSDVARWFRCPLSLRSVVVNALEPVAGTTLRPRAANSPISDKRDDAVAAAGAALDDDDRFVITGP